MANEAKKSPIIAIVVAVVVIGAGIGAYFMLSGKETTTTTNQAANTAVTNTNQAAANTNAAAADPYDDLMQYDGKTVEITSTDGKVTGSVAISIDQTQGRPIIAVYFMKVKDSLPKSIAATGGGASYYYIASHAAAANIRNGTGTGTFSEAFCNPEQMPDVLALAEARSIETELYRGCDAQYDPWHTTETFYHIYADYFDSSDFNYNLIIGKDTLAVFDTAPFYQEDPEIGGYNADDATVISQGEITTQYNLIYTD